MDRKHEQYIKPHNETNTFDLPWAHCDCKWKFDFNALPANPIHILFAGLKCYNFLMLSQR